MGAGERTVNILSTLTENPITAKELRGRMRGRRAYLLISLYVLAMSIVVLMVYGIFRTSGTSAAASSGSQAGKLMFFALSIVEIFFVSFLTPAFTAGAISSERERQTYDLLRTTLLSERRLVFGKLVSSTAFIILLLVVSIPLQSYAFLMGGITITEVVLTFVLLLFSAITFGSLGLYLSARIRKTSGATIAALLISLVIVLAVPLLLLLIVAITSGIYVSNPLVDTILTIMAVVISAISPLSSAILSEVILLEGGNAFFHTTAMSTGGSVTLPLPWIVTCVYMTIATILLLRATISKVTQRDE